MLPKTVIVISNQHSGPGVIVDIDYYATNTLINSVTATFFLRGTDLNGVYQTIPFEHRFGPKERKLIGKTDSNFNSISPFQLRNVQFEIDEVR